MTAAATTDLAISVRGLNKHLGALHAVRDVSIDVRRGQICGFLGPNGSGKTTTIRMLCGLMKPDSGEGACLGLDILRQSAAIKREVGYMTQRFSFYEDMSIRENLRFVARMYGVPRPRKVVNETLERLGLTRRQKQLAGTLSGGWKQRMALAACILHNPQLLLLDEPTAGVDPKARREFWDQIHILATEGLTVLVSTHYMDEAERCNVIAYLDTGRMLARGSVADIVRSSGLTTWHVDAPDPVRLAAELRKQPGVAMVAAFGNTLHVSGPDTAALGQAIAPLRFQPGLEWRESEPSLEDAFIALMERNRAQGAAAA
ncbi:MAG: ABC transporter ATP-binding protein [Alphaproteobacteria bacterium]|nr:ABC transporter ATP-binding protein [Alphaproteobacteria bacterium]